MRKIVIIFTLLYYSLPGQKDSSHIFNRWSKHIWGMETAILKTRWNTINSYAVGDMIQLNYRGNVDINFNITYNKIKNQTYLFGFKIGWYNVTNKFETVPQYSKYISKDTSDPNITTEKILYTKNKITSQKDYLIFSVTMGKFFLNQFLFRPFISINLSYLLNIKNNYSIHSSTLQTTNYINENGTILSITTETISNQNFIHTNTNNIYISCASGIWYDLSKKNAISISIPINYFVQNSTSFSNWNYGLTFNWMVKI